MPKEKKYLNTQQFLKEMQKSGGLPKRISTEAQLWDEIFKKEAYLMQEQFFPLIQEIHGKTYPKVMSMKPLATEYPVERIKTKEITSVRSDTAVLVGGQDIYHFECEIGIDRSMVLRMFEYDAHVALEYHRLDSKMEQSEKFLKLALTFPYSAVLYLQDNKNIPDKLSCIICFPDGVTYEYQASAVRVQSYSLEEIQKKHLSILIPFLPLRFRKHLPPNRKESQVTKEELTSFYQDIILILDKEIKDGYLSENNRKVILSLLRKAMIRVFHQDKALLEEVITMTEPILELEFEQMERMAGQLAIELAEELAEERAKKLAEELAEERAKKLAEELAEERAKKLAEELAEEKAKKLAEELAEHKAEQRVSLLEKQYNKSVKELALQKDREISQREEEIATLKRMLWVLQNPQKEE